MQKKQHLKLSFQTTLKCFLSFEYRQIVKDYDLYLEIFTAFPLHYHRSIVAQNENLPYKIAY